MDMANQFFSIQIDDCKGPSEDYLDEEHPTFKFCWLLLECKGGSNYFKICMFFLHQIVEGNIYV
jgi:hypothetical protein